MTHSLDAAAVDKRERSLNTAQAQSTHTQRQPSSPEALADDETKFDDDEESDSDDNDAIVQSPRTRLRVQQLLAATLSGLEGAKRFIRARTPSPPSETTGVNGKSACGLA